MSDGNLTKTIESIAKRELGFSQVGIISAKPAATFTAFSAWIDEGYHATMDWMHTEGRGAKRQDVRHIMPTAKSIVTLVYSYYTEDLPEEIVQDPSRGIFARYTWGRDYHKVLKKKLRQLVDRVQEEVGHTIETKAYVDTGPVLERELAQRAGLGFVGKNSMLINAAYGSYLFVCEVLIDQECEPLVHRQPTSRANDWGGCRNCTRCIDICPTKAIIRPGVIDARKCISYLTIEHRLAIPEEFRPFMKNRIYGCDICQEICPWNQTATAKSHQSDWLEADLEQQAPKLVELAKLTPDDFLKRFQGTPIMRVKRNGLLRNVAVALGNWAAAYPESTEAKASLELLVQDPDSLIREHAEWGLRQ